MSTLDSLSLKGESNRVDFQGIPVIVVVHKFSDIHIAIIRGIRRDSSGSNTGNPYIFPGIDGFPIPNFLDCSFSNNISVPQERFPDVAGIRTDRSFHNIRVFEIFGFEHLSHQGIWILNDSPHLFCQESFVE